jgi:two-component system sensor histidine kinase KdpD
MDELDRPDPDELLMRLAEDDERERRGRLKVFLGYAAGVGKTFAMLEAAHQRMGEGVDVVAAYVETHGRKETGQMLAGLESVPRKGIEYRGVSLTEMDLDAVLARRPQLALVDELAHTNAPGSRHPKRYQDVEELLAAGIDVYTTVNIQHLESMNDVVHQITGVKVHETIPDSLMDQADEIEVIDLPPEELQIRLKEGKIYIPDQATRAIDKFFRKGNLTALRELSLRRAAERVGDEMRAYMQEKAIAGPWPAGDRILVCLSSHPLGDRLIRTGRRLADDLNAEWFVMFVETPGHLHMPPANRERIQANMILAEQLGATIINLPGTDVAQTVVEFARRQNITKIIAGKPLRPTWLEVLRGGSVVDQIIQTSGPIDVYIVSEKEEAPFRQVRPAQLLARRWDRYIKSILLVGLVTLVSFPVAAVLEPTNLVMLYLAAVVISAVYWGRGPSILASVLSVVAFDFFFIEPRLRFSVNDTEYILTFIGLLVVGLIISSSASLLRDQVDLLRRREAQARALNVLSKELTAAVDMEGVLQVVLRELEETFGRQVVILLAEGNRLVNRAASASFHLEESEMAIAMWAHSHGRPAGRGTDTLTASSIRYLPLSTSRGVVGVLGIRPHDSGRYLTQDQRLLMENFANLAALAIERASFAEQAAQTETLRSTEQLQAALLNSISHELRTPLASIMGVLTSLEADQEREWLGERQRTGVGRHLQEGSGLDADTRLDLIQAAADQTRQLNQLVGNLLDMTRLQAGAARLNLTLTDVEEMVGAVLTRIEERANGCQVETDVPADLPLVPLDTVLVGQALINLLDNAFKYSPAGQVVTVAARVVGNELHLAVRDKGPGIPYGEIDRVFDKFYRGSASSQVGGTGLGLAICRGIAEAHGGRIWAENNPDSGLTVTMAFPIARKEA